MTKLMFLKYENPLMKIRELGRLDDLLHPDTIDDIAYGASCGREGGWITKEEQIESEWLHE